MTTDPKQRKTYPIATGVLDYFPDALAEVAHVSYVGNQQHNPGQPLHWAKEKSTDEPDALMRHLIQRGTIDTDGIRHSAKVAWRALALLQREIEAEREANKVSDKGQHNDGLCDWCGLKVIAVKGSGLCASCYKEQHGT
jgi:hypothetical protein